MKKLQIFVLILLGVSTLIAAALWVTTFFIQIDKK